MREALEQIASMSEQITFQGFIDFVNSQPPEKKIWHSSWEGCAVGEYLEFVTGCSPHYLAGDTARRILPEVLHSLLNATETAKATIPTYGALSDFISKL